MTEMKHVSVLLDESIDMLNIKKDGIYVDCTLGRGGHSEQILKRCPEGHLFAFDLDMNAIEESRPRLSAISDNFTLVHEPFENLGRVLDEHKISQVDGILMDLGVSSPQFDDASRGFSYRYDARLDMRMNQEAELDAWKVVNTYSQEDLTRIFREYGEDPFASKIARKICETRSNRPINTTFELVDVIRSALPPAVLRKKGHPAKQVFQALRIEVNQELAQLQKVLDEGLKRLAPGGRMAVITFHSLEDRMVKKTFAKAALPPKTDKRLPQMGIENLEYRLINRKPVLASDQELAENSRAHSAKLRGIERNENKGESRKPKS